MKFQCKHCGDEFTLSKQDQELLDNGEIERPDTCEECYAHMGFYGTALENEFSDAGPGL